MQSSACNNCHQTSWVTIGTKHYCAHCGALQGSPVESPVAASDRKAATDIAKPTSPPRALVTKPQTASTSAQSLHGRSALAAGGVLDLRKIQSAPSKPARPAQPTPQPTSKAISDLRPSAKPAPVAAPAAVEQPSAPAPEPQVKAPAIIKPEPAPVAKPEPKAAQKFEDSKQSLAKIAAELNTPAEAATEPAKPKSGNGITIAAAALSILIMGGYIWFGNYNNLSLRTASARAGIVASLPQYVPSGYSLDGPIGYGPGFVSFNFAAKNDKTQKVAVTQRKTDWNSNSLFELYVKPKAPSETAVSTVNAQGLKIYVIDGHQATWVNHGLQYVVQASSSLSHDQLIKVAESL